MAFDQDTWAFVIISIILPLLSIQIINRLEQSTQNFIYGGKVSSPTFNVLAILFGVRQTAHSRLLPKRRTPRLIFMIFIFYSLIIRTCYQKLSFEFLTHDIYAKDYYSINDLIQNNYTFVTISRTLVRDFPDVKIVSPDTFGDIITKECRKDSKFVLFVSTIFEVQINRLLPYCNWFKSYIRMEDSLVLSVPKNNEFSDLFLQAVSHFTNSGVFNVKWEFIFAKIEYFKPVLHVPNVLTLTDMGFYFEIWLAALSFPITVFIFEVVIFKYRSQSRIRAKSKEQNSFKYIDLPINAGEVQPTQCTLNPEQDEDKSANQSNAEDWNEIPAKENESSIETFEETSQTTAMITCNDEKEENSILDKTGDDNGDRSQKGSKEADNSID